MSHIFSPNTVHANNCSTRCRQALKTSTAMRLKRNDLIIHTTNTQQLLCNKVTRLWLVPSSRVRARKGLPLENKMPRWSNQELTLSHVLLTSRASRAMHFCQGKRYVKRRTNQTLENMWRQEEHAKALTSVANYICMDYWKGTELSQTCRRSCRTLWHDQITNA